MICTISVGFKHLNSDVRKGTIHSVFLFSFKYCYVAKIPTKLLAKKMKRRESLKSKQNGNQVALEFDCEGKKEKENG
jgi:hypothetical protein